MKTRGRSWDDLIGSIKARSDFISKIVGEPNAITIQIPELAVDDATIESRLDIRFGSAYHVHIWQHWKEFGGEDYGITNWNLNFDTVRRGLYDRQNAERWEPASSGFEVSFGGNQIFRDSYFSADSLYVEDDFELVREVIRTEILANLERELCHGLGQFQDYTEFDEVAVWNNEHTGERDEDRVPYDVKPHDVILAHFFERFGYPVFFYRRNANQERFKRGDVAYIEGVLDDHIATTTDASTHPGIRAYSNAQKDHVIAQVTERRDLLDPAIPISTKVADKGWIKLTNVPGRQGKSYNILVIPENGALFGTNNQVIGVQKIAADLQELETYEPYTILETTSVPDMITLGMTGQIDCIVIDSGVHLHQRLRANPLYYADIGYVADSQDIPEEDDGIFSMDNKSHNMRYARELNKAGAEFGHEPVPVVAVPGDITTMNLAPLIYRALHPEAFSNADSI